jgi:integrase
MKLFKTYRTFEEILPEHLTERKIALTHRSFAGEVSKFRRFDSWLNSHDLHDKSLRKISNRDIARFFVEIAGELDKPTCQKYFISIRGLWQFAFKVGEIGKTLPFDLVVFPTKKDDYSPALIPREDFCELMEDIKKNDRQLYLASMIVYYAFIRPGRELRLLKTDDFNFELGYIRVIAQNAKTRKQRFVTIPPELMEVCIAYGIDDADPGLFVFGSKGKISKRHIGINSLAARFNVFRTKHGLSRKVKFYSFKHTGMTDMLNAGVPLLAVQGQAGHDRLTSTQHYAKKYAGIINPSIKTYLRTA